MSSLNACTSNELLEANDKRQKELRNEFNNCSIDRRIKDKLTGILFH